MNPCSPFMGFARIFVSYHPCLLPRSRDLKLENLLLATRAPAAPLKIADFGLSKSFLEDPLRTICGSPQYVAPEVLCVGLLRASYGCAADLWSLGVVLFILLAGFSPFDDDSEARMFERIRTGRYSVEGPLWEGVSEPGGGMVNGQERQFDVVHQQFVASLSS